MPSVLMVLLAAIAPLVNSGTESKWKVTRGAVQLGTVTLLTSSNAGRVEWKATEKAAPEVFIGTGGKVWMRGSGGDIDVATLSATMPPRDVAQALLVPYGPNSTAQSKDGKVSTSAYGGAKATYSYDDKGANKITIKSGNDTYVVTRTSIATSSASASNFTVRPRSSTASRLSRLSGDLLGPGNTQVAATAGGRGVGTKGLRLNDGGDYASVEKIENRDANWSANLDKSLEEFQKDGKVGRGRGEQ
jgi:hypothetical protein